MNSLYRPAPPTPLVPCRLLFSLPHPQHINLWVSFSYQHTQLPRAFFFVIKKKSRAPLPPPGCHVRVCVCWCSLQGDSAITKSNPVFLWRNQWIQNYLCGSVCVCVYGQAGVLFISVLCSACHPAYVPVIRRPGNVCEVWKLLVFITFFVHEFFIAQTR